MRDRIVNTWIRRRPRHRQSDCIFALLICSILILITYMILTETSVLMAVLPYLGRGPILLPVFTRTLLNSIITLDSLKRPDRQHNINFFPVPGRYVPLFHVGFGILMGYRINETLLVRCEKKSHKIEQTRQWTICSCTVPSSLVFATNKHTQRS